MLFTIETLCYTLCLSVHVTVMQNQNTINDLEEVLTGITSKMETLFLFFVQIVLLFCFF